MMGFYKGVARIFLQEGGGRWVFLDFQGGQRPEFWIVVWFKKTEGRATLPLAWAPAGSGKEVT